MHHKSAGLRKKHNLDRLLLPWSSSRSVPLNLSMHALYLSVVIFPASLWLYAQNRRVTRIGPSDFLNVQIQFKSQPWLDFFVPTIAYRSDLELALSVRRYDLLIILAHFAVVIATWSLINGVIGNVYLNSINFHIKSWASEPISVGRPESELLDNVFCRPTFWSKLSKYITA